MKKLSIFSLLFCFSFLLLWCQNNKEENEEIIAQDKKLELSLKKECLSLSNDYKKQLEGIYDYEDEETKSFLFDYKMFYNSELNSCISAYEVWNISKEHDIHYYFIDDYLNWEKRLFFCEDRDGVSYTNTDEKYNKADFGSWCEIKWENRIEYYWNN